MPLDSIRKPKKAVKLVPLAAERVALGVGFIGSSFRRFIRLAMVSKISLVLLLITMVVPLSAFEAHIVNVTATIERKPCKDFPTRNRSTWLAHAGEWVLPQILGDIEVVFPADAAHYLDTNSGRIDRLRAQLLALKFTIAHFGAGEAHVPGESITLNQLAMQNMAVFATVLAYFVSTVAAMVAFVMNPVVHWLIPLIGLGSCGYVLKLCIQKLIISGVSFAFLSVFSVGILAALIHKAVFHTILKKT